MEQSGLKAAPYFRRVSNAWWIGSEAKPQLFLERGLSVFINHERMAGLLLCSLVVCSLVCLGGCAASNHPMTKMIRVQRDMMQELADVLHRVDDVSDLESATKEIENLTEQMRRSMAQVTKSMGKDTMPTSQAEAKRLQSAMQREMKKLQPIMKQIQNEMARLAKHDWSSPLLEAVKNYKAESNVKSQ